MKIRPLVLAAALLSALPARSLADGANIGLYTDAAGNTCSFTGNAPGTVTAYLVFRPDAGGVNTVQFSAPVPACLGAVFLNETVTPGMTMLGNSQSGASILVQSCFSQPVSVLQINDLRSASTEPCCPYPILPDPSLSEIAASNCAFQEVDVTSVVAHFNADASCACQGNSPPTPPELPVPPNGAPSVSVSPTFTWWSSDFDNNITGYDIYLGTTSPPPLVASNVPVMSYTPPTPLPQLTLHYWRVVVRDAAGAQTSGPTWTFTTRETNPPPSPPSNPVPGNGALQTLINLTLDWHGFDPDGEPVTFDVYFGTSSPPPLVASDLAVSQYALPQLAYNTMYRWRIVARDPIDQETSGPEWSFTTRPSNFPPNPPSVVDPFNGETTVPLDQVLRWSATDPESDPLVFDVFIDTANPPALVATNVPTNSYAPAGLQYSTQYYWRVAVHDTAGNITTGSVWSFFTRPSNLPPYTPSNPIPAQLATGQPLNATLSWTGGDPDNQLLTYDVYFGTASPPPLVASNIDTTYYAPGPLSPTTTYRWRIVARDPLGLFTTGPTWQFTTQTIGNPPTQPSTPFPSNNALNQPTSLTLSWSSIDPDGQQLLFDVYFGTAATPPLVASGIATMFYNPGSLNPNTLYRWRIVARDPDGNQSSGPTWNFTTAPGNSPPAVPAIVSPPNGGVNQPLTPTLRWSCSDPNNDPLNYDVYFGTASPPPLLATGVTQLLYPLGTLSPGVLYRWKIVARDSHGAETPGPVWSFTTKANALPVVSNPWPVNGTSSVLLPTLRWHGSDADGTALVYDLYFGTGGNIVLVADNLTQATYTPPAPLEPQVTYYWYVEVSDGIATVAGPMWNFTPRIPGDVVTDGVLTMADVECTLQIYLWNPVCGSPGAYQVGDVDCNYNVTPRDVRCIHKEIVDGSCDVCISGGNLVEKPRTPSDGMWPIIKLTSVHTELDTLVVRLAVSNLPSLEAFGFHTLAPSNIRPIAMMRRGATSSFTRFEWRNVGSNSAMFAGYTLGSVPINEEVEFIELRFDVSDGMEGTLFITDYVDDLTGSNSVYVPFGPTVDVAPPARELVLHQNHPNPFNPQTTITYDLPASAERIPVRLYVLDISGRVIDKLVDEEQSSGLHTVRWEGVDENRQRVASGVYFYVLQAGDERRTRKMVLLK